jgi:hypothetical protein
MTHTIVTDLHSLLNSHPQQSIAIRAHIDTLNKAIKKEDGIGIAMATTSARNFINEVTSKANPLSPSAPAQGKMPDYAGGIAKIIGETLCTVYGDQEKAAEMLITLGASIPDLGRACVEAGARKLVFDYLARHPGTGSGRAMFPQGN